MWIIPFPDFQFTTCERGNFPGRMPLFLEISRIQAHSQVRHVT